MELYLIALNWNELNRAELKRSKKLFKNTVSVTLRFGPRRFVLLCAVHVYARVHTSIYIYIYICACIYINIYMYTDGSV